MKILKTNLLLLSFCVFSIHAQRGELKTIEEVIQGIDDLLGNAPSADIGNAPIPASSLSPASAPFTSDFEFPSINNSSFPTLSNGERIQINNRYNPPPTEPPTKSFRLDNELIPPNLRDKIQVGDENPVVENPADNLSTNDDLLKTPEDLMPTEQPLPSAVKATDLLPNIDYKKAGIEELLLEVDTLELPEFEAPIVLPPAGSVSKLPEKVDAIDPTVNRDVVIRSENDPNSGRNPDAVDFIVLGERIDEELREKIREAIMSTRYASGGTDNPFVTRTVFKAVSNCNRVLGRLTAPFHKRYRRDVLLSMIRMHERNRAWVDAIKTYERYMEEFAADDDYPFEEHEDAPGIPDLQASVGSLRKWTEGRDRGAPTIPETHVRMGKIYRKLGAHRMAMNKFYDAINATLTLPKNNAFEIADRRSGRNFENRSDAESNQAMFEIAETFMDSEDYDQAVKFYDRLWRLEQLRDFDRAIVRFKQGLAHYRRAVENLRINEKNKSLPEESRKNAELPFEKTPRADFAKVKEVLRGYGTVYPQSPYVPESHYLLALTYEQLNDPEESIKELIVLLKESEFNPNNYKDLDRDRAQRDRDVDYSSKMKQVWNFWKKKTGNYLANKFFEDAEFFNAYRVYSVMRKIDPSPSWQVPVLYQIALCQEKLGNFVQATETYLSIEEFVSTVKEAREDLANSEYLNFVFGMAKWRREQLEETRSIRQAVKRFGIFQTSAPGDPSLSALGN